MIFFIKMLLNSAAKHCKDLGYSFLIFGIIPLVSFITINILTFASGDISAGGNVGLTITSTKQRDGNRIIGTEVNFGLGVPAGPFPINVSTGVKNTHVINDFR